MQNNIQESIERDATPFSLKASVILLIVGVGVGYMITSMFAAASFAVTYMAKLNWLGSFISKFGLLVGTLSFILPAFFYMKRQRKLLVPTFRINTISTNVLLSTLIFSLGLFVATDAVDRVVAPVINGFLDRTIGALSPELMSDRILEKLMQEFKLNDWITGSMLVLAAVFAAGFAEEMLMRGMFQGALEKKYSAAAAIIISSLVFSMIHLNPWGGIQIFVIALFLGIVAWRTNSIVPTIIMHGMNNGLVILFNNLEPETVAWYGDKTQIESNVMIIGLLLAFVGLLGIFIFSKNKQ
ncbi:CPBP family intramembrane metalloprotease [bacterium]|nr:CPBP family intramembrane metalloprotease [bacterium]